MNWKEVVTAGGVIGSLLFVGFEIRESPMFREWWSSTNPESRWSADFVAFMERDVIGISR